MTDFYTDQASHSIPIVGVDFSRLEQWLLSQPASVRRWVQSCEFIAKPGQVCLVADAEGSLQIVLLGIENASDFWWFGSLPRLLPKQVYSIFNEDHFFNSFQYQRALMAWGLGCYQFNAYVERDDYAGRQIFISKNELEHLEKLVSTVFLVRDLINTPAADMGPEQLAEAAQEIAAENEAKVKIIKGQQLLKENYPTIYAVGKGAEQEPCLIDMTWGDLKNPKITLVGKGVCFDTGGLDLKPSAGMREMKKDMGGAAHALGLARLIMQSDLPVRLRVLIPAVENAIDGCSYHPGDIIKTRAGLSVEIDNTDAEGRLILCDALAEAITDSPDYLIDFATLTGAARVALGPDLAALFCNDDNFASEVLESAKQVIDPMWRMPLYLPYQQFLKSELADMQNASKVPMGGAITAALFLQRFVPDHIRWMHFDIFASNLETRPGRPVGGEMSAVRAVFDFLQKKYQD